MLKKSIKNIYDYFSNCQHLNIFTLKCRPKNKLAWVGLWSTHGEIRDITCAACKLSIGHYILKYKGMNPLIRYKCQFQF